MNFVNQFHPISICQACVARGADDEDLMRSTQSLTKAIADYKVAAKTVKGLESQSRPKAKAKAKAGSAPAPSAWVWLFEEMRDYMLSHVLRGSDWLQGSHPGQVTRWLV